tara:strand:+ start:84 stop:284 length:201 start_codon:yes stop_codon:yes gene_type:complete
MIKKQKKETNINKIKEEIINLKKSLLNYQFQKSSGQLEKTSKIKIAKKEIARLKTQINQLRGANNA